MAAGEARLVRLSVGITRRLWRRFRMRGMAERRQVFWLNRPERAIAIVSFIDLARNKKKSRDLGIKNQYAYIKGVRKKRVPQRVRSVGENVGARI